jgi:LemA protein
MMGKIMVNVENYPDLKASSNFNQLQGTWNEVEGNIAASRRFYNSAVTSYNDTIQVFPNSIFAGMFGFQAKKVFEIAASERENVSAKDLWS